LPIPSHAQHNIRLIIALSNFWWVVCRKGKMSKTGASVIY